MDMAYFALRYIHQRRQISTPIIVAYQAMIVDDVEALFDVVNYVGSPAFIVNACEMYEFEMDECYKLPFRIGNKCFDGLMGMTHQLKYPKTMFINIIISQINHGVDVMPVIDYYYPTIPRNEVLRDTIKAIKNDPNRFNNRGINIGKTLDGIFMPRMSAWTESKIKKAGMRVMYRHLTLSDMYMLVSRGLVKERLDVPRSYTRLGYLFDATTANNFTYDTFKDALRDGILARKFHGGLVWPREKIVVKDPTMAGKIIVNAALLVNPIIYPGLVSLLTRLEGMTMVGALRIVQEMTMSTMILSIFEEEMPRGFHDVIVITSSDHEESQELGNIDSTGDEYMVREMFDNTHKYIPSYRAPLPVVGKYERILVRLVQGYMKKLDV